MRCKNVIFVFLSRRGQHIGRKEKSAGDQSPVRDVMWRRKHFVPGGPGSEGVVFFYRYNVPSGTKKTNIFRNIDTFFTFTCREGRA